MGAEATMKMVVLYEDEVRTAAKAMDQLREELANDSADTSEETRYEAWTTAIRACMVALAGAEDTEATLVLANKGDLLGRAAECGRAHRPTDTR